MGSGNPEVHEVHVYATCDRTARRMVAKFGNTPFDKMEEKENPLPATPFGDKEIGSNGS